MKDQHGFEFGEAEELDFVLTGDHGQQGGVGGKGDNLCFAVGFETREWARGPVGSGKQLRLESGADEPIPVVAEGAGGTSASHPLQSCPARAGVPDADPAVLGAGRGEPSGVWAESDGVGAGMGTDLKHLVGQRSIEKGGVPTQGVGDGQSGSVPVEAQPGPVRPPQDGPALADFEIVRRKRADIPAAQAPVIDGEDRVPRRMKSQGAGAGGVQVAEFGSKARVQQHSPGVGEDGSHGCRGFQVDAEHIATKRGKLAIGEEFRSSEFHLTEVAMVDDWADLISRGLEMEAAGEARCLEGNLTRPEVGDLKHVAR